MVTCVKEEESFITIKCSKCAFKFAHELKDLDSNQPIAYRQWINKKEVRHLKGSDKEVRLVTKTTIECPLRDLLDIFL